MDKLALAALSRYLRVNHTFVERLIVINGVEHVTRVYIVPEPMTAAAAGTQLANEIVDTMRKAKCP